MSWKRLFVTLLLALLLPIVMPLTGFGVGTTGTLLGRVTDPSGAFVAKAKVVIRNQETNAVREMETNSRGEYVGPLLPPGTYEVAVEVEGFRRAVENSVQVDVDQIVRVDITLQIGDVTQRVLVAAATPMIQTDSSALGQVIVQASVGGLPLNERNFLSFALLVPGVQMSADGSQNASQGGAISVNGAREQSNNFLVDGVDNNDLLINQFSLLPSVDAIQEFKVQSSNYSAEFGRSGGAQINVVLKGGSNNFHGTLFEFFRNRKLDAKNFLDLPDCTANSVPGTCGPVPRFDRNQFGGTLGGPVQRDRTFFFLSYEGLRLRQATTREAAVPSQVQRAASLTAVSPASRNPAGFAVFNLLPAANVGADFNNSNRFSAAPTIRDTAQLFEVKLDHGVGLKDMFSGHYALYDDDRYNPFDPLIPFTNLPGYGSFWEGRGHHLGIAWTHLINPRLTNEFRIGFNRRRGGVFQENSGTSKSRELGFPDVSMNPVDLGFPGVFIAGFDGIGEPRNLPQDRHDNTFHWVENLAWNPGFHGGRHQLRLGADIRRFQSNLFLDALARGQWFFLGVFTGDPLQDLLRGLPTFALAARGDTSTALRTTELNFYAQDDIRISDRLTLNVGLRWEYNGPPVDIRDRFSAPDLSSRSVTCSPKPDCQFILAGSEGLPRATYSADRNNLAPRIGFAWRPTAGNRFVIRSAYGIFYDVGILNPNIFPRFNPPFFAIQLFPNSGTRNIQDILSQAPFPQSPIATMIDAMYRDGYLQHWNLDVQYELRPNIVLDLAYVGSRGTHLATQRNLNQAPPGTGAFPFPQFGPINLIPSTASSDYNSLQIRAEKRLSEGLSLLAGYTWSKSIDNASALVSTAADPGFPQDSLNLRAERGLSSFHTQHRLVISALYLLPFGRGQRWIRGQGILPRLLSEWRVSGILALQSGRPFTVNRGIDQSLSGAASLGIFADRPNQVGNPFQPGPVAGNPDPLCHLTISNGGRAADRVRTPQSWFNPCAFIDPGVAFGNTGRNSLIGPDLKNFDFSVAREMRLAETGQRLQLRADFFNLFNHPNFDLPDRIFDSKTFAQLRSANVNGNKPPRQIQLGVRYVF